MRGKIGYYFGLLNVGFVRIAVVNSVLSRCHAANDCFEPIVAVFRAGKFAHAENP